MRALQGTWSESEFTKRVHFIYSFIGFIFDDHRSVDFQDHCVTAKEAQAWMSAPLYYNWVWLK